MGAPAQPNQPTQVYYDPETSQYFSYGKAENSNGMANLLMGMGLPITTVNGPVSRERNYLNNPYTTSVANRIPQGTVSPYPSTDALFPSLNAGLVGSLLQGSQPTGAMYGAGKYLTGTNLLSMPTTTTSESKGK
jgi:hypothetical protein